MRNKIWQIKKDVKSNVLIHKAILDAINCNTATEFSDLLMILEI